MEQHELNLSKIPAPLLLWYGQNAGRFPGGKAATLTAFGFRKLCCSKPVWKRSAPITAAFSPPSAILAPLPGADDERLLKLWQGLGYYSRAKNLKKAAQMVMENFGGQFPRRYEDIRAPSRHRRLHRRGHFVHLLRRKKGGGGWQRPSGLHPSLRRIFRHQLARL